MISKSLRRIIYDDGFGEVPAQYRQILDVIPVNTNAVLPKQPVFDPFPIRIQQIQQLVGVDPLGSREQDDLEHLRHLLHEFPEKRPGSHVHSVRTVLEQDRKAETGVRQFLQTAMDQSFVQVQYLEKKST